MIPLGGLAPTVEWSVDWDIIIGVVGALILIGGFVLVAWRVINPIARKATRISEFILGRPKDALGPAIPSLSDRLDGQDSAIAEIRKQVTPNSGTSAHDNITRRIDKLDAKVDALFAELGVEPPEVRDDPPVGGTD